jgi:hypothetical protein
LAIAVDSNEIGVINHDEWANNRLFENITTSKIPANRVLARLGESFWGLNRFGSISR